MTTPCILCTKQIGNVDFFQYKDEMLIPVSKINIILFNKQDGMTPDHCVVVSEKGPFIFNEITMETFFRPNP